MPILTALTCLLLALSQRPPSPTPAPSPPPPPPAELTGLVELVGRDGQKSSAEGTVIWISGFAAPLPKGTPTIMSQEKRFAPHVLAVAKGTTVSFPNVDRIFHNVFSRTPGSEFDLGLYRRGAARSVKFDSPGLVRVYCNIHPDMAAYVRVVEDGSFSVTGPDGTYRIGDIPPGRYLVRAWNEKGGERDTAVQLAPGARRTANFLLDASKYKKLPHKNKHGQDYPPVTRDVDRY